MSKLYEALADLKKNCPPSLEPIAKRLADAINDQTAECATLRHGLDLADRHRAELQQKNVDLLLALREVRKCGNGGAKLSRTASDMVRAALAAHDGPAAEKAAGLRSSVTLPADGGESGNG